LVELLYSEISQREALGDLLDHCFGVAGGRHFFEDFPIWDPAVVPRGPKLVRLGAWKGDRLVASAGLRLAELALGDSSRTPVALIGAVATDPAFRGRGLASQLTAELVKRAAEAGAALALLWGSEHRMYARLGFELAGSQIRAPLARLELGAKGEAPAIVRGWTDALFPLIQSRARGVILEDSDLEWYRAHRHVEWLRAERQGKIVAYAAFGRGIDLGGIVHEWGGEPGALAHLLMSVLAAHPEAELLGPADASQFGLNKHPAERLALVLKIAHAGPLPPLWVWGLDAV
jgi:GNAT superfamily N-acetyltransferase